MKQQKSQPNNTAISGITLVALIITIIILIILAAVTIKAFTHEGLIDMAIKAGEGYRVSEGKELEELNRVVNELDDIQRGGIKDLGVIEGTISFGDLEWTNGKAKVTITKITDANYEIEYKVVDREGSEVQDYVRLASGEKTIDLSLGDLVIARLTDGKNYTLDTATLEVTDTAAPTVSASTGTVTTNSLQVTSVSAADGQAGMPSTINYSYYIKQSSGSYPANANYTGTETSYNFTGLTQRTSYDIKVTATDIAGNTGVKEIKGITTGTVPDGGDGISTGAITFGSLTWSSQKASVKINKTTSDSLSIEYQVLDKNNNVTRSYQTIASGGTVSNLNLGDFVVARLTDGTNHGNTASIEVTDGTAPSKPTLAVTSGTAGNNGWYRSNVTVTITPGTDAQSGVLKTTYTATGSQTIAETEGTSVTITADGTSYITAYTYDNAGHKTASSQLTIKKDATNPPTATVTISSYTGNTVTVSTSMSSTSDTSGIAKYILEYKKSSASTWATAVEQTTRPSTYKFTGLEANTSYNFRVRTIDNAGNTGTGTSISQTTDEARDSMNPNIDTTYGGITISYTPKEGQVYNTEGKTSTTSSGSDEYSGYGFQYFQTSDLPSGWQVWGTDDDYIYIISTNPTSKNLYLSNYTGYNNGVTLLDNICDSVYTDKTTYPDSSAQNLKLEQVLAVMSDTAVNNQTTYYGRKYQIGHAFITPKIWNIYESNQDTAITNRSKAYGLITRGGAETSYSDYAYHSYWAGAGSNISDWRTNGTGTSYKDIMYSGGYYWLSTRCVSAASSIEFRTPGYDLQYNLQAPELHTCGPPTRIARNRVLAMPWCDLSYLSLHQCIV